MDKLRILIAEDENLMAFGLRLQLKDIGHKVVGAAKDGEEAIKMAERHRPDLVLLDIKMPKKDGLEVTRELMRKRPVPIIILARYSDRKFIEKADAAGAMAYLLKPVVDANLKPAIQIAVSRFSELQRLRQEIVSLRKNKKLVTGEKLRQFRT